MRNNKKTAILALMDETSKKGKSTKKPDSKLFYVYRLIFLIRSSPSPLMHHDNSQAKYGPASEAGDTGGAEEEVQEGNLQILRKEWISRTYHFHQVTAEECEEHWQKQFESSAKTCSHAFWKVTLVFIYPRMERS